MPATATPITHYENFPVASWLCPARLRPHVAAIYHYARTADDLADEGLATAEERLHQLARYRAALRATCAAAAGPQHFRPASAPPADPDAWPEVFGPLGHTVAATSLPETLLADLLTAFELDVVRTRDGWIPETRDDLLDYCRYSANPVGRLMLHLYGVHGHEAQHESDAICSALQLINFWQDLSQDIARGRHYIPRADRERFGLSDTALAAREPVPEMAAFVADVTRWTRAHMLKGAALVHRLPGRLGWELRAVVQGGLRMLEHVEALGAQAIATRRKLGRQDLLTIAWRALWM